MSNNKPIRKVEFTSTEKVNYFRRLIDNKDQASVKRFLGLTMSAFLIIAFFVVLLTGKTNANTELLDKAMLYAVLIVLMALFGLAVDKVMEILLLVSKTRAAAQILTPAPTVNKVANVEGDVTGSQAATDVENHKHEEDFGDDEDLAQIKKNLTKNLKE